MIDDSPLQIRSYRSADLDAVISVFQLAVRELASSDYDRDQIDAWARVDREGWSRTRSSRPTWIAQSGEVVIGFTDLEPDGHLDMMFVHPGYARRGVATALLRAVEAAARAQGMVRLFTDASLTARPFFDRHGFSATAAQIVEKRGQHFKNFRMERFLT